MSNIFKEILFNFSIISRGFKSKIYGKVVAHKKLAVYFSIFGEDEQIAHETGIVQLIAQLMI